MSIHNHIILPEQTREKIDFITPHSGGGAKAYPQRDKLQHADFLNRRFDEAWVRQEEIRQERTAIALPCRDGSYIEFKSQIGNELATESLEDQRSGIRLLNIRKIKIDEDNYQQAATIYIPSGKEGKFITKLNEYKTKLTRTGAPSHDKLFRSIEDLGLATLRALWTDKPSSFPNDNQTQYEVWIRTEASEDNGNTECQSFIDSLIAADYEVKKDYLLFHERAVVMVTTNRNGLSELLERYNCIAEFRLASTPASFWCQESTKDQNDWVNDLLQRLYVDQGNDVLACMLDSGINNAHPLLQPLIPDENCLTSIPRNGTFDPGEGHGTLMAGIIEYGNLEEKLESTSLVTITNRLCSIKILPNAGVNPTDMYGPITQQSIYRAEAAFPRDRKLYCMAVTAAASERGVPSSWSGAIDQLAYSDGTNTRLMLISAGNIQLSPENNTIWDIYPSGNRLRSIQDPAQSWNALTIGGYTGKIAFDHNPQYQVVARPGEMSPFSRTSVLWDSSAPIKPEVVFEAGNLYKTANPADPYTTSESLESLTTNAQYRLRKPFTTIGATSLATAIATEKASTLMQKYPEFWPETIRAIMVHCAEWTDAMIQQFPANNKKEMGLRLRNVGYGVPNEQRMLNSLDNALTLVTQDTIQPFVKKKKNGSYSYEMNEMSLVKLPWPTAILSDLGEQMAKIRITLSYFIDPGPGEIGWKNKYRYQSCGLRFELNDVNESVEHFKNRVNKKMRDEDYVAIHVDSGRWKLGVNNRDVGSIHSDFIEDMAINLAGCKYVAIYPVGGWWKSRTNLKKFNSRIRYSLIVSLETPNQNVDIYTEVATQIENLIEVPIEIPVEH